VNWKVIYTCCNHASLGCHYQVTIEVVKFATFTEYLVASYHSVSVRLLPLFCHHQSAHLKPLQSNLFCICQVVTFVSVMSSLFTSRLKLKSLQRQHVAPLWKSQMNGYVRSENARHSPTRLHLEIKVQKSY
jgi:hypothetical protein